MHEGVEFTRRFAEHLGLFLPAALLGVGIGMLLGWLCATLTRVATHGRRRGARLAGLVLPWRAAAACAPLLVVNTLVFIRRSMFLNIPVTGHWAGLLVVALTGLAGAWGGTWGALMDRDLGRPPLVALVSRLRTVMIVCLVAGGLYAGLIGAGGLGAPYIRGLQMVRTGLMLRSVSLFFVIAATVDVVGGVVASLFWRADSSPPPAG